MSLYTDEKFLFIPNLKFFYRFFKDNYSLAIDTQFLWGKSLLISPFLERGAKAMELYLPKGTHWFNFYSVGLINYLINDYVIVLFNTIQGKKESGGSIINVIQRRYSRIPLYVRAGSIIPMRLSEGSASSSIYYPYQLLITLDENDQASGEVYHDDGETISNPITILYSPFFL